jgi:malonyl-CoA O-methyltransferase
LPDICMPTDRPPTISPSAAAHWQRTAPATTPWLHEEVASRMVERLHWINLQPEAWTCFLPIAGEFISDNAIKNIAINSHIGSKWQLANLFKGKTKIKYASPADGKVDMLWANMHLHNALDPQALIKQWHTALATDGFLMFSCLGPDTLRELRGMYELLGWPPPSHQFTDMHDWGDMLIQAGFAEPVMDMERIVLTYETPQKLLQDLRELGRNLHPDRFTALRGKAWKAKLDDALVEHLADPAEGGRLKLTFEVIYGHAMKPKPRVKLSEHSAVSLQDMRVMLQGSRRR